MFSITRIKGFLRKSHHSNLSTYDLLIIVFIPGALVIALIAFYNEYTSEKDLIFSQNLSNDVGSTVTTTIALFSEVGVKRLRPMSSKSISNSKAIVYNPDARTGDLICGFDDIHSNPIMCVVFDANLPAFSAEINNTGTGFDIYISNSTMGIQYDWVSDRIAESILLAAFVFAEAGPANTARFK